MSNAAYHVRRATVDDLPRLHALWATMNFSAEKLEPRLTEFQLIESQAGDLLGALALEVIGRSAILHSEVFVEFDLANEFRKLLWIRLQSLARSLGLARIWTFETAPFWKEQGFERADEETLAELPQPWTSLKCEWLQMRLRDEAAIKKAVDIEFKRLQQEEQRRTAGALNPISAIRYGAIFIAIVVAIVVVAFCVYLLRYYPNLLHRRY